MLNGPHNTEANQEVKKKTLIGMNGCHLSLISSSNNTFVGCAALTLNHTVHTIITSGRGGKIFHVGLLLV